MITTLSNPFKSYLISPFAMSTITVDLGQQSMLLITNLLLGYLVDKVALIKRFSSKNIPCWYSTSAVAEVQRVAWNTAESEQKNTYADRQESPK